MGAPAITMDVRRVGEKTAVVDIRGEVTAACEPVLMSAYEAARGRHHEQAGPELRRPGVHEQRRHRDARHAARPGQPAAPGARRLRAERALSRDLRADQARRGDHDLRQRGIGAQRRREVGAMSETKGPEKVASAEQIGLSHREATATPAPPEAAVLAPRNADSWAKKVDRLKVDQREGVRGTNVAGRRLTGPVQGFGKMWQKTYRMDAGPDVTPEQAIATWREHFPEFWPKGNRFAGALT